MPQPLDHVDYNSLDKAKNAFIRASKRTVNFARQYGFIPGERFGASANIFALDLKPFINSNSENLYITLLPEGLGTADDARPDDMSENESKTFWYNIGIKTVAVMTNDAASSGMQTILISLYLPSSNPELIFNERFMQGFLDGFVDGCERVGCVYFSGETPQLKTKIYPDKLDIAGSLFGIVPAGMTHIDTSKISAGNHMVFVESRGPNENGFTSLRKLAESLPQGYRTALPSGQEYWKAINNPSILYTSLVQKILSTGIYPTNIEPISGHGWQKIMRSQKHLRYTIEEILPVPEIFEFVQKQSGTPKEEMIKIFNYGLGMVIFVKTKDEAKQVISIAAKEGLNAIIGGYVEEADIREVLVKPMNTTLKSDQFLLKQ